MDKPNLQLIIGPSGCGKTHLLLNTILETEYRQHFDYIIILAPTLYINKTYMNWKYVSDKDVILVETKPEYLDVLLQYIIKMYTGVKTAIIVDDMSNSTEQHANNSNLSYLAYSGRHHNISLFIVSQKLNSISTGVRQNCTRLIFFKTHNRQSINILKEEFFGLLDKDEDKGLLNKLSNGNYLDIKLSPQASYDVK